jgi:hypothetical protein
MAHDELVKLRKWLDEDGCHWGEHERGIAAAFETIEQQAARIAELQQALVDMEPIPYCEVCGSCGEVGCGCTHKCKFAFDHPDVEAKITELDNRAMDLLLLSDKQAARIAKLEAALGQITKATELAMYSLGGYDGRFGLRKAANAARAALEQEQ